MIPPAIKSFERSKRFWTDYLAITDPESERDGDAYRTRYGSFSQLHLIEWELPSGFRLRLQLDGSLESELFLVTAKDEAHLLGWDDQSHWHPHVLRRDELERLCRAIALMSPSDPDSQHPGWPIRLLDRFAPVCDEDDIQVVYASFFDAHRRKSELDDRTIARLTRGSDCRGNGFTWKQHPEFGWVIEQTDDDAERSLYSLRQSPVERSPEEQQVIEQLQAQGMTGPQRRFPFEHWNTCLSAVNESLEKLRVIGDESDDAKMFAESGDDTSHRLFVQTVDSVGLGELASQLEGDWPTSLWVCEHAINLPIGMLSSDCTPDFVIPASRSFVIHYGIPEHPRACESPLFEKVFVAGLDAMLRDLDVGSAEMISGGSRKTSDGHYVPTDENDAVQTTLSEKELVDVIRNWFVFGGGPVAGADGGPRPTVTRKSYRDPLDDDLHQPPKDRHIFNLVRLRTEHGSWGFALRRCVLEDGERREIASTLLRAGFEVFLRPQADGGDGVTVEWDESRSHSTEALWQMMHEHQLILLPHLVIATQQAIAQIGKHQAKVLLAATPTELADALGQTWSR